MKLQPSYFEFFTQAENPYFDISWMNEFDMDWVDSVDDDDVSKDFDSIDFPLSHHWPEEFKAKFQQSVSDSNKKIASLISKADEVVKIDEMTIYLDCPDSHHYFSTPFYANGEIQRAGIDEDSQYDSAETAVYIFINEWNNWNEKYGKSYRNACKLSELDALCVKEQSSEDNNECQHEDLGSLGYVHGETVICPFCGKNAEVW